MNGVRAPAVAGTWYPGQAAALTAAVTAHLAAVPAFSAGVPRAIIAPHAGLRYSGPVAAHAYAAARAAAPDAIVLVGPSHFVPFAGVSVWPAGAWQTPLGPVAVAADLADAIAGRSPVITSHPAAHGREHSLEMQLPFVAHLFPGVPIVPLVMGDQGRGRCEALGAALVAGIEAWTAGSGRRVLLVASSDLSHYEDARTARRLDAVVATHVEALDPEGLMGALDAEPRHACGGGAMVAVLRAARELGASASRVLHYADSGDVTGDKSAVVGYLAAAAW